MKRLQGCFSSVVVCNTRGKALLAWQSQRRACRFPQGSRVKKLTEPNHFFGIFQKQQAEPTMGMALSPWLYSEGVNRARPLFWHFSKTTGNKVRCFFPWCAPHLVPWSGRKGCSISELDSKRSGTFRVPAASGLASLGLALSQTGGVFPEPSTFLRSRNLPRSWVSGTFLGQAGMVAAFQS